MKLAMVMVLSGLCGCATEQPDEHDPLLDAEPASKGDSWSRSGQTTENIRWLSQRSEPELAGLFARGSATSIPRGQARQQPLLGHTGVGLLPFVEVFFLGTDWVDGDHVYSVYVGGHRAPYAGDASLSTISRLSPNSGARPPAGTSKPHFLSPYDNPIVIDDGKPSVFVDYQNEPTPILNRSIDEFREIDPARCPGLYLVRTHYLKNVRRSEWAYLFYIAADFGAPDRKCSL